MEIPVHLAPFVARQDPQLYTAIDHASWRYIMKLSRAFLSEHAHEMYLEGLIKTGISSEEIPLISDMDQKLRRFGWQAVPVSGFVPPAVFMEFLSLGILPIACDMRKLEHLAYTPAPDIVHEAAGHAPIIADPAYAAYLRRYGEISRKAIFSSEDWEVYVAIRNLSEIKEDPSSSAEAIAEAQERLNRAQASVSYVSEASQLARMSWWTIEYGLIGPMSSPKIYGAGLLSSVGESANFLSPEVRKVPLTLDCVNVSYDITRPQPQLFVARDFPSMSDVLEQLAETMAFRRGGEPALERARHARTVTTTVFESGLQVSGVLESFEHPNGTPTRLRYSGPCQLAFADRELEGKGADTYHDGLELRGRDIPGRVISVFGGPADRARYLVATGGFSRGQGQAPRDPKCNLTSENRELERNYAVVRELRKGASRDEAARILAKMHEDLARNHPDDWLLRFELLELNSIYHLSAAWAESCLDRLRAIAAHDQTRGQLIERGLRLIGLSLERPRAA